MVEDENTPEITNDDMDTLRILLHTIRGISPVSTTTAYVPNDSEAESEE